MKKNFPHLFILVFSIFYVINVYATSDIVDISCFEQKSTISGLKSEKTIKIKTKTSNIFVVSNNQLLNYKLFKYGNKKYLDYKILSLAGGLQDNINSINDLDINSYFSFDQYDLEKKELIIEFPSILKSNTFYSEFRYSYGVNSENFISLDGIKYVKVRESDLHEFDLKFLKVVFNDFDNEDRKKIIKIHEIGFFTKDLDVFLLNPKSLDEIEIYTNDKCERGENFKSLLNKYSKENSKAEYSIDIDTEQFEISFEQNQVYNSDFDNDNINNKIDNCPFQSNGDQKDVDGDLIGDICDYDNENKNPFEKDIDNDGIGDNLDNCKYLFNPKQNDINADGIGDLCSDDDKDHIIGNLDNCINIYNPDQKDVNVNGIGDACEFDKDSDGIFDSIDNCIVIVNPEQKDEDFDGIGDKCDNCNLYNPQQLDKNGNKIGDKCEIVKKIKEINDKDKDGIEDGIDNCMLLSNPDQKDKDKDGVGDKCDNCEDIQNMNQADKNNNLIGDLCEDSDSDGIVGYLDNCIEIGNPKQDDADNNGIGDSCEDKDGDKIIFIYDNCQYKYNPDQSDIDKDKIGDVCDEQDDRFIESNKGFFIGLMILITIIFASLIYMMIGKIKNKNL